MKETNIIVVVVNLEFKIELQASLYMYSHHLPIMLSYKILEYSAPSVSTGVYSEHRLRNTKVIKDRKQNNSTETNPK